jgi:D-psicose/D-tagatose/L-ribulose 3-epimerase
MKLAVSDLAWQPAEDEAAARLLRGLDVRYIELAPTKVWPNLDEVAVPEARALRQKWADRGLEVVALQAILFGHPELRLFGSDADRERLLQYLGGIFRLASELGAGVLVFGSPKNRLRGDLSPEQALDSAAELFRAAGAAAADQGVTLLIEPNAPQYGCDFITTAAEGAELVARTDSPGFGLHLDAGCMTMAGDDPADAAEYPPQHFHVSAPFLGPVTREAVDYRPFAAALAAHQGYVSIEMKPEADGNLKRVEAAIQTVRDAWQA